MKGIDIESKEDIEITSQQFEENPESSEENQEEVVEESKHYIIVVRDSDIQLEDIKVLEEAFDNGWILNTQVRSNPVRLEKTAIYHLVRPEVLSEPEEIQPIDFFEGVDGFKNSPNDEVEKWLNEGYRILDHAHIYSKTTILIKRDEDISDQPPSEIASKESKLNKDKLIFK